MAFINSNTGLQRAIAAKKLKEPTLYIHIVSSIQWGSKSTGIKLIVVIIIVTFHRRIYNIYLWKEGIFSILPDRQDWVTDPTMSRRGTRVCRRRSVSRDRATRRHLEKEENKYFILNNIIDKLLTFIFHFHFFSSFSW